jgi:hypothetical protein
VLWDGLSFCYLLLSVLFLWPCLVLGCFSSVYRLGSLFWFCFRGLLGDFYHVKLHLVLAFTLINLSLIKKKHKCLSYELFL